MQTIHSTFSQHLPHLTDYNQNMWRFSFKNINNIKNFINGSKYQKEMSWNQRAFLHKEYMVMQSKSVLMDYFGSYNICCKLLIHLLFQHFSSCACNKYQQYFVTEKGCISKTAYTLHSKSPLWNIKVHTINTANLWWC